MVRKKAAVCGKERCVTTLKTTAKQTICLYFFSFDWAGWVFLAAISWCGPAMLSQRTATIPGTSCPTLLCGFFDVPRNCEHSRVVRRGLRLIVLIRVDLKVLIVCRCNYEGSTFSLVILRPWVLVRPESNSRPLTRHTVDQPTEPQVHASFRDKVYLVYWGKTQWMRMLAFIFRPGLKFRIDYMRLFQIFRPVWPGWKS